MLLVLLLVVAACCCAGGLLLLNSRTAPPPPPPSPPPPPGLRRAFWPPLVAACPVHVRLLHEGAASDEVAPDLCGAAAAPVLKRLLHDVPHLAGFTCGGGGDRPTSPPPPATAIVTDAAAVAQVYGLWDSDSFPSHLFPVLKLSCDYGLQLSSDCTVETREVYLRTCVGGGQLHAHAATSSFSDTVMSVGPNGQGGMWVTTSLSGMTLPLDLHPAVSQTPQLTASVQVTAGDGSVVELEFTLDTVYLVPMLLASGRQVLVEVIKTGGSLASVKLVSPPPKRLVLRLLQPPPPFLTATSTRASTAPTGEDDPPGSTRVGERCDM